MSSHHGPNDQVQDDLRSEPLLFLLLRFASIAGFLPPRSVIESPYVKAILDYGDAWEFGKFEAVQLMGREERINAFARALNLLESDEMLKSIGFFERVEFDFERFMLRHYGRERLVKLARAYLSKLETGEPID